jgi:hypothetical protein
MCVCKCVGKMNRRERERERERDVLAFRALTSHIQLDPKCWTGKITNVGDIYRTLEPSLGI